MRYVDSRKGLYVHCGGVAWPGSGLEIKDRGPVDDAKVKLKGYWANGFHLLLEDARSKAITLNLLREYQQRVFKRLGH